MRIVLTGGGSGGHIKPFAPIIEALRSLHLSQRESLSKSLDPQTLDSYFLGVENQYARELFGSYTIPIISIPSGKIRRYASGLTIIDILFRLPFGILKALWHVWNIMPDVVVSKGGYGSIPVVLAAVFYQIPILLHESDSVVGLANRKLARFSTVICVGFAAAKQELQKWAHKVFVTGTPTHVRENVVSNTEGKRAFDIPAEERVLLIVGGSQGAQQLNEIILQILPSILVDMAVIHITGPDNFKAVSTVGAEIVEHSPRKNLYKPFPYLAAEMPAALAAADGIVSRAGASSLADIAALRKPALLIPLASAAGDHQRKNAQNFEASGAAIVLDPTNLSKNIFEGNVRRMMTDGATRSALEQNLAGIDTPNAAADIAGMALKLAQGFAPRKK